MTAARRQIDTRELRRLKREGLIADEEGKPLESLLPFTRKAKRDADVDQKKPVEKDESLEVLRNIVQSSDTRFEALIGVMADLVDQVKTIKETNLGSVITEWKFDIKRNEKDLMDSIKVKAVKLYGAQGLHQSEGE